MIIQLIINMPIGILAVVFGLLIWKKQKVSLIHSYHYKNAKQENVASYTRLIGIGMVLIGSSICMTGLINFIFKTGWGWIVFFIGFISGLMKINKAQKTYNDTWFS